MGLYQIFDKKYSKNTQENLKYAVICSRNLEYQAIS